MLSESSPTYWCHPLHVFTVWLPTSTEDFKKAFQTGGLAISPCSRVQGQLSNVALNFASDQNVLEGVLPLVVNTPSIINPLTEHTFFWHQQCISCKWAQNHTFRTNFLPLFFALHPEVLSVQLMRNVSDSRMNIIQQLNCVESSWAVHIETPWGSSIKA
jgi:hypothetical protein